jgi:hypothetical protein
MIPLAKRNPNKKQLISYINNTTINTINNTTINTTINTINNRKQEIKPLISQENENLDEETLHYPYNFSKEYMVDLSVGTEEEWDKYIQYLYRNAPDNISLQDLYKYEYLNVLTKFTGYNITASENFNTYHEDDEEDEYNDDTYTEYEYDEDDDSYEEQSDNETNTIH